MFQVRLPQDTAGKSPCVRFAHYRVFCDFSLRCKTALLTFLPAATRAASTKSASPATKATVRAAAESART